MEDETKEDSLLEVAGVTDSNYEMSFGNKLLSWVVVVVLVVVLSSWLVNNLPSKEKESTTQTEQNDQPESEEARKSTPKDKKEFTLSNGWYYTDADDKYRNYLNTPIDPDSAYHFKLEQASTKEKLWYISSGTCKSLHVQIINNGKVVDEFDIGEKHESRVIEGTYKYIDEFIITSNDSLGGKMRHGIPKVFPDNICPIKLLEKKKIS